ncbi:aromatic-ring-hydroxylating dioxygenase subunit beta [Phytoactinopolyspora mesophila]|uniref:3-phenylpropionate/cinnamic acid dioxygenase subunit beta n=1 Tax=Phytoactinopolyspora mesophila TaxID=2650750 RepID=A0A7K3MAK6_9ACTN|nr:3-phenylpropionate/cinnamic acid dioxygenase subunit beta [Phytoactinopolyspora mesophila]NDL60351.1 3-phenylpropionate/cinnamic acid dioxygenase subunit beta [Phytoactinopolyspora mesophila]
MALNVTGVDRETRESIREFLYLESLALDERRFRDWLEAFADDAHYEIPVRVTREKLSEWELSPTSRIFDDTKETLDVRVKRLETDFAWSEQPPSRTRHFITNIIVQPTEKADEYLALSSCLVYRSRGEEITPSLFSAQRRDLLRRDGDSWLIVHRWAALDQAVVNAHNMSIFI